MILLNSAILTICQIDRFYYCPELLILPALVTEQMTNEELRTIENAARAGDATTVESTIQQATGKADFQSYTLNSTISQLIRSGLYSALDQLVDKELLPTDLYEYERFDTSVLNVLLKPQFQSDEALEGYVGWFSGYLGALDDIDEEVGNVTLLEYAITANTPMPILKAIVDAGANPAHSDQYGRTLLYKVCGMRMHRPEQTTALVEWLLEAGVDVEAATVDGKTALHAAIESGKQEATVKLLEAGADPNAVDKNGESAFYYATVGQHNPVLFESMLAFQTPDFHAVTKQGENLLNGYLRAMYTDNEQALKIVELMLRHGADITGVSSWYSQEKTGADWVTEKSADLLALVIEGGFLDSQYRDNDGNTLLHKVCRIDLNYDEGKARELYRKVKFLLKQGVDPAVENVEDKKAVDYAMGDNLKAKTVELLLKD